MNNNHACLCGGKLSWDIEAVVIDFYVCIWRRLSWLKFKILCTEGGKVRASHPLKIGGRITTKMRFFHPLISRSNPVQRCISRWELI